MDYPHVEILFGKSNPLRFQLGPESFQDRHEKTVGT